MNIVVVSSTRGAKFFESVHAVPRVGDYVYLDGQLHIVNMVEWWPPMSVLGALNLGLYLGCPASEYPIEALVRVD